MRGVTKTKYCGLEVFIFQSTRLMRGVTPYVTVDFYNTLFQSTRLMRGVTIVMLKLGQIAVYFNPHASCEAWPKRNIRKSTQHKFQSTRLMRGVTNACVIRWECRSISIHTPHARRDYRFKRSRICRFEFQSTRLMRGVTPQAFWFWGGGGTFQSTRLMRGVTV